MQGDLAIELFEKFQPRFRKIRWEVCVGVDNIVYGGERQKYELCRLYPMLRGQAKARHYQYGAAFDLRKGGLRPTLRFNPLKPVSLEAQLLASITDEIESELKKTKFYLDPLRDGLMYGLRFDRTVAYATYTCEAAMPGLILGGKFRVPDWTFYFPDGPEREAIRVALELVREEAQRDHRTGAYCNQLHRTLDKHLKEAA